MPVYCYSNNGKVIERIFKMGEAPKFVMDYGTRYDRDIGAEHTLGQPVGDLWPVFSEGAGCHPDQVPQFREEAKKRGVPTDFTPDGRAVFRDKGHRREYLKKFGLVDRAGYN